MHFKLKATLKADAHEPDRILISDMDIANGNLKISNYGSN